MKKIMIVLTTPALIILFIITMVLALIEYLAQKGDTYTAGLATRLKWYRARLKYEIYEQSGGTPRNTKFSE